MSRNSASVSRPTAGVEAELVEMRTTMRTTMTLGFFLVMSTSWATQAQGKSKIIHDAGYYILEAQKGGKWTAEDEELDAKLAELRTKRRC